MEVVGEGEGDVGGGREGELDCASSTIITLSTKNQDG